MRTGSAARVLACLNNLIVGLLRAVQPTLTLPQAQRSYVARPTKFFDLVRQPIR